MADGDELLDHFEGAAEPEPLHRLWRGEGSHDAPAISEETKGRWFTHDRLTADGYARQNKGHLYYLDVAAHEVPATSGLAILAPPEVAARKEHAPECPGCKTDVKPCAACGMKLNGSQEFCPCGAGRVPRFGDEFRHEAAAALQPLPMEPGLYYRTHHKDAPFGREHAQTQNIGEPPHPDLAKYWEPKPGYSAFWNPHHLHQYHEEMGWSGDKDAMKDRRVLMFRGTPVGEGADGEPRVMPGSDKQAGSMSWRKFQDRLEVTPDGHGRWSEHTWGDGPNGQMVDDGYRTIGGDHRTAAARPARGQETCPCCGGKGDHGDKCKACGGSGFVDKGAPVEHCPGQPQPKRRHWRERNVTASAQDGDMEGSAGKWPEGTTIRTVPPEEYGKYEYPDYPVKTLPALARHFKKTNPAYWETLRNHVQEHGVEAPILTRNQQAGRPLKRPRVMDGHNRAAAAYSLGLSIPVGDYDNQADYDAAFEHGRQWFAQNSELKAQGQPPWRKEAAQPEPEYVAPPDEGTGWAETLRQLRYRKKNEPEMHRGMAIALPQELHDFVTDRYQTPDRQARAIAEHLRTQGLGMHWSSNPDISRFFAGAEKGRQSGTMKVIVHARLPEVGHIETDPARLREGGVLRNDNWMGGEKEIPLKEGAPVHVTGVTWYGYRNRKRRGGVWGMEHTAGREVTAGFEHPLAPGRLGEQGYRIHDENRGWSAERQGYGGGFTPQQSWGTLRMVHPNGETHGILDYAQSGRDSDPYHEAHVENVDAAGHAGKGIASALMDHLYAAHPEQASVTHSLRTDDGGDWWPRYLARRPEIAAREERQRAAEEDTMPDEDDSRELLGHFEAGGMLDLYHHTTPENAASITAQGRFINGEPHHEGPQAFFTTEPDPAVSQGAGRGGAVVHIRVPERLAVLDDDFGDEQHYRITQAKILPRHIIGVLPQDPSLGHREAADEPDASYRMQHQGPDADDGEALHEIGTGKTWPKDFRERSWEYSLGANEESMDKVYKSRDWPSRKVWAYRALPSPHREVNPGDWVSTSSRYARSEGRTSTNSDDDYPVVKFQARAEHLRNEGNSLDEWSYHGPPVTRALVHYSGGKNHRNKGGRAKTDALCSEHEPAEMYSAYEAQNAERRQRLRAERQQREGVAAHAAELSDDEIHRGLNMPASEQGRSQMKGEDLRGKFDKLFLGDDGDWEDYRLSKANEFAGDLRRRYEGQPASEHGHFGFEHNEDDKPGEPTGSGYYEIHHHNQTGRDTGWRIRHRNDGPEAEIMHAGTGDDAHQAIELPRQSYASNAPHDWFGHEHLKKMLYAWHEGQLDPDEPDTNREYLEGPHGEPGIRRWQRGHLGAIQAQAQVNHEDMDEAQLRQHMRDRHGFIDSPEDPDWLIDETHRSEHADAPLEHSHPDLESDPEWDEEVGKNLGDKDFLGQHGIEAALQADGSSELLEHFGDAEGDAPGKPAGAVTAAAEPAVPEYGRKPEHDWAAQLKMADDDPQRHANWEQWHQEDRDWNTSIRRGLSMGHLTSDRARELGYHGNGHEHAEPTAPGRAPYAFTGWQHLPQEMYHVTTDMPSVRAHGLKSREELGQQRGHGLGGGEDDTISLTTDRDLAHHMLRALHEYHGMLNDPQGPAKMWESARRGEGADHPFHQEMARYHDRNWKEGDPLPRSLDAALRGVETKYGGLVNTPEEMAKDEGPGWRPHHESAELTGRDGVKRYNVWERPNTGSALMHQRSDMYKNFSYWRSHAGRTPDPLFISNDVEGFAARDPQHFGMVHVRPRPGAQGYPVSGMGEWRTTTGDALDVHRAQRLEGGHIREASLKSHYGATDWDRAYGKLPDEIHRGLYAPESHQVFTMPMSDDDVAHGLIAAHQEEHFPYDRDQHEKFGTHWTTDEGVARDFAHEHETEHAADDQDPGHDHDEHFEAVPVVFHAQRPQRHEIEDDPRRLGWQNVDDYATHGEREVPIRHGAPVRITGVSWLKHTGLGPMWHRHDLREPVVLRAEDRDSPDDPNEWNGEDGGHQKEAAVSAIAVRYEAGLPNPHTGGEEWFHGTHSRPEDLHHGFHTPSPDSQEDQELRGHLSYWNTHLGSHWAAAHSLADHFARQGASVEDDSDEEYREPSSRYEERTPNAVVHARLHLRNPKVYRSEHDMDNEAYEHETRAGNWIAHHFEGYEDEDPSHPDYDPDDAGDGEEWPLAARFRHDKDQPLIGRDEAPIQGIFSAHSPGQRKRAQWLSSHPDKAGIVDRFRQRLTDQGHDGIIYGNELEREHIQGGENGRQCAIAFHPHQAEITQHHETERPCLNRGEAEEQRRRMPQEGQEELPGAEEHADRFSGGFLHGAALIAHFEPKTAAPYYMQQKLFHQQPDRGQLPEGSPRHNPYDPEGHLHWRAEHDEDYEPDECPHCGGDLKRREHHQEQHDAWLGEQDWHTDWDADDLPDTIHRGMSVHLPPDVHETVHNEALPHEQRARALMGHMLRPGNHGVGNFWSGDPDVSKSYAETTRAPGYHREETPATPVMLHARFPGMEHVETDPEQLEYWGVHSYHKAHNREVPVQNQAPLQVSGVSWARPDHAVRDTPSPYRFGEWDQTGPHHLHQDPAWSHHEFGGEGIRATASGSLEDGHRDLAASDDDGDRYVTCGQGHSHWGAEGAAGLLIRHHGDDGQTRYLLQERSPEVHEGGTWSTPGGALRRGESPEQGARREAEEELGSLPEGVTHHHTFEDDHGGGWKYHTVVMDSPTRFRPGGGDDDSEWESEAHRWVTPEQMKSLPLHPGFAASWGRVQKSGALEEPVVAHFGEEHPIQVYRGLHLGYGTPEEADAVHRNPGRHLQTGYGVGVHWTQSGDSAYNFAHGLGPYGHRNDEPEDETHHSLGLILKGEVHPSHIVRPGTEEWENYAAGGGILDPSHPEQETTIRENAPVRVTHLMTSTIDPHGNERYEEHPYGHEHQASVQVTAQAALEVTAMPADWMDGGDHEIAPWDGSRLFHGTRTPLEPGDEITPEEAQRHQSHPDEDSKGYIHATTRGEEAAYWGEHASPYATHARMTEQGRGREPRLDRGENQGHAYPPRVYEVEHTGPVEPDPTGEGHSYRSASPLRVVREVRPLQCPECPDTGRSTEHWPDHPHWDFLKQQEDEDDEDWNERHGALAVVAHFDRDDEPDGGDAFSMAHVPYAEPPRTEADLRKHMGGHGWGAASWTVPDLLEVHDRIHGENDPDHHHQAPGGHHDPVFGAVELVAHFGEDDDEPYEEPYRRVNSEEDEHGYQWPMREGLESGERDRVPDEPPRCTHCARGAHSAYEYHWPEDGHHPDVQARMDRDRDREDRWDRGEYDRTRFCGIGCEQGHAEDQRHGVSTGHTFSVGEPEWADDPHPLDRELWQRDPIAIGPHEEPLDRRDSGYEVRDPSAAHRCHYCRSVLPQYRRQAALSATAAYDRATDEGPYEWDEIGDRYPHLYGGHSDQDAGESTEGEAIGDAAAHLYHDRPGHPYEETYGGLHPSYGDSGGMVFHPRTVDPARIDYARSDPGDGRVRHAQQGYESQTPERVPPVVLVHRHGIFYPADGHHRSEGAAKARKPVRAYVAYSPHEEPFSSGERGPYHGAETEDRPAYPDQNGVHRRISYPGFPHAAETGIPMQHEGVLVEHFGTEAKRRIECSECGGQVDDGRCRGCGQEMAVSRLPGASPWKAYPVVRGIEQADIDPGRSAEDDEFLQGHGIEASLVAHFGAASTVSVHGMDLTPEEARAHLLHSHHVDLGGIDAGDHELFSLHEAQHPGDGPGSDEHPAPGARPAYAGEEVSGPDSAGWHEGEDASSNPGFTAALAASRDHWDMTEPEMRLHLRDKHEIADPAGDPALAHWDEHSGDVQRHVHPDLEREFVRAANPSIPQGDAFISAPHSGPIDPVFGAMQPGPDALSAREERGDRWHDFGNRYSTDLHRGIITTLPGSLDAHVHDESVPREKRAQALQAHFAGDGLGMHWTPHVNVARRAIHNAADDDESSWGAWRNENDTWEDPDEAEFYGGDEDDEPQGRRTEVMFHVHRPGERNKLRNPQELEQHGVYHGQESEFPVKSGAPLKLSGISWRQHEPEHPHEPFEHVDFPKPVRHIASRTPVTTAKKVPVTAKKTAGIAKTAAKALPAATAVATAGGVFAGAAEAARAVASWSPSDSPEIAGVLGDLPSMFEALGTGLDALAGRLEETPVDADIIDEIAGMAGVARVARDDSHEVLARLRRLATEGTWEDPKD